MECRHDGCDKKAISKIGDCAMHHARLYRNGHYGLMTKEERGMAVRIGRGVLDPFAGLPEGRLCTSCDVWKPADDFYVVKRPNREYLMGRCKECFNKARSEWVAEKAVEREAARQAILNSPCTAEGCERNIEVFISNLCKMHHERSRRGISLDQPVRGRKKSVIEGTNQRLCTTCDEVKPESGFYRSNGKLKATCKACGIAMSRVRSLLVTHNSPQRARKLAESFTGGLRTKAIDFLDRKEGGSE